MKVHSVVDTDIHPPRSGGTQRLFGLARGLAARHSVRVLCLVPNRNTAAATETVAGVQLLRRKAWHTSVAWRLDRMGLAPLFNAARGHRANAERYRVALGSEGDVLACDLNLAGMLASGAVPLKVYASQNVEYDRFVQSSARVWRRAYWSERLRALEGAAVRDAHLTVTCSDEDAVRMRDLYGVPEGSVAVIPNGYDETALRPPSPEERARARVAIGVREDAYVVAFVGADWGPNREALAGLVRRVMPALASDGIHLLVVGSVGRSLAHTQESWLRVVGEVPELTPLLHAADAGVNPMIGGGGSNVKVPAYLAAGLAVVTTPFGLRGYPSLSTHCVVVESESLADALRARPRGWNAREEAAPEALGEYAWGRLGEKLGKLYEARLSQRAATEQGAA
ncbi:MAG: glycosyltransferase family 4 protein [Candidatus Eisenbacteria bacterium]